MPIFVMENEFIYKFNIFELKTLNLKINAINSVQT